MPFFNFVTMAYNTLNHRKRVRYVLDVYRKHKECDVPDTYIIRNIFPKHNIFLSYRQWMNYKNMPEREVSATCLRQLRMF
jgi:hypothetical protein